MQKSFTREYIENEPEKKNVVQLDWGGMNKIWTSSPSNSWTHVIFLITPLPT